MKKAVQKGALSMDTLCVRQVTIEEDGFNSIVPPLYASASFAFNDPNQFPSFYYSRAGNPTRSALEKTIAALEGGEGALCTATGMAAITLVTELLSPGDHIVAGQDIYSGTYRLFSEVLTSRNIRCTFVDMRNPADIERAIEPSTAAIWIESPSNPMMHLVDIQVVSEIAHEHDLISIVDNTFASPYCQLPLSLGADLVVHSASKYLNGHSDVLGGAVITRDRDMADRLASLLNVTGACCSAFDSWLILRGIKTLSCRMARHGANALALAEFLEKHPLVTRVYYPGLPSHTQHELARRQMVGFSGMLSFDIQGGKGKAYRFMKSLDLFPIAGSLGGVESLIQHPDSMSHACIPPEQRRAAGLTGNTLRVSVGLESIDDLIGDMTQAFERC